MAEDLSNIFFTKYVLELVQTFRKSGSPANIKRVAEKTVTHEDTPSDSFEARDYGSNIECKKGGLL